MADERGTLGAIGGMLSDAVMSAAARVARPSAGDQPPPGSAPSPPAAPQAPVVAPTADAPGTAAHDGGGVGGVAASVVARIAPAVIDRVDVDAIVERVDVDRLVGRVDVNRVLGRVDIDAVLDRVDPNRLLDRVDVDRVVERVDVGPLAREAVEGLDLGEIVRESTVGLGGETVRDARLQAMRADRALEHAADRLLGREPRGAVIPAPGRWTSRAGIVSRVAATVIDSVVVILAGLALLLVIASVRLLWAGGFDLGFVEVAATRAGAVVLLLAYLTYGWGLDGRTVGKLVMGLRVLDEGGTDLSYRRAFARAVLAVVFPVGLLWSAVSERAASVQDLLVRTVVVHDWGGGRAPERPERRHTGSPPA